jgi:hypothetical protein
MEFQNIRDFINEAVEFCKQHGVNFDDHDAVEQMKKKLGVE